ncbi:MAG TPA: histidine kinase [Gemmatimonadaceae bacterium]|nr:histidine kinase [Gemmatimonadaceae bacterium]
MTLAIAENPQKQGEGTVRRMARRILTVPLASKIIGANVIIVAAGFVYEVIARGPAERTTVIALVLAMIVASIVNVALVRIALKPVQDLVILAEKVSAGDFSARGTPSRFADAELRTLGTTVNSLLDALALERRRIRDLGAEVIYAQDAERARVSRELHDSIAQTLAGVKYQIAAAGGEASDDVRNRLAAASAMIASVTDEIREVSYSLHPRVAEDLGLESALTTLARQVKARSGVDVSVSIQTSPVSIPINVSATIYRVAEEALKNIEMHARAKKATVDVASGEGSIRIEVTDDGQGFDLDRMNRVVGRSGLASVKDRVVLAGGTMKIDSKPNGGTRVMAELHTSEVAK